MKQLERIAISEKLDDVERIMRVLIVEEPFTAQNGLLTNTQKLKRNAVKQKYAHDIENLYIKCMNSFNFEM